MARKDDFALLVGIRNYPHTQYADLDGPTNDVELMYSWLVDPSGGDVEKSNVTKLVSPDPRQDPAPKNYSPTNSEVWSALKDIVMGPAGNLVRRPHGRLYLFFSGHGFSSFDDLLNHAALYTANADKLEHSHVCGTKMAVWCTNAAVFGEIVLIMDCCRDQEISKHAEPAPFIIVRHPDARHVKRFEVYAVPYNGKAQERMIRRKGKTLGVLTYALESALRSAPLVAHGKNEVARTGHAVKTFMEGVWGSIVGEERIEQPSFVLPSSGDIVLTKAPPMPVSRTIRLSKPLESSAVLEVYGDDAEEPIMKAHLSPITKEITWETPVPQPPEVFDGTAVTLQLLPAAYEVVIKRDDVTVTTATLSMMGEDDVVLAV